MNLPWLRLYTEFSSDPKIQILAFEDQRHYVMLLCLKGNGTLDAAVPTEAYRDRLIAKGLGLDPAAALEAKRRLMEGGLIDDIWQPTKWESRQFQSDYSTLRVQKYREKQKGNVTETLPKRSETVIDQSQNRSESDQSQKRTKKSIPSESHSDKSEIAEVFEHWKVTFDHPKASLDAKRSALIKRALKGYSVADLCASISGYRHSPHHMGQNERQTVYDAIELFLRDAEHIDKGLRFAEAPPPITSELTNHNVRVLQNWRPADEAVRHAEVSGDSGEFGGGIRQAALPATR
jgi:hypothetical protein